MSYILEWAERPVRTHMLQQLNEWIENARRRITRITTHANNPPLTSIDMTVNVDNRTGGDHHLPPIAHERDQTIYNWPQDYTIDHMHVPTGVPTHTCVQLNYDNTMPVVEHLP